VFSKTQCGYCTIAKQLLQRERLEALVIELDQPNLYPDIDMNTLIGQMLGRTKCGTVPQIFIKLAQKKKQNKNLFDNE
jgi:glutaredoxin